LFSSLWLVLLGFIMREKYKRDGLFKQQILFVIPEIHNELSAIQINAIID